MTFRLSSGRRYLNGELVDPPQLGLWTEADLFPEFDFEDCVTAGLYEIPFDADDWEIVNEWLLSIDDSEFPLHFLIERCCDDGYLLPVEIRETRLKDFPRPWINACEFAIQDAPNEFAHELFRVLFWSVRIERARRLAEADPKKS